MIMKKHIFLLAIVFSVIFMCRSVWSSSYYFENTRIKNYSGPATQGWTKSLYNPDGFLVEDPAGNFYIATHYTDGGSAGIAGSKTKNTYGSWQNPENDIPLVDNQLYRVKYSIRTSQSDQNAVPNVRLMIEASTNSTVAASCGGRIGGGIFAPTIPGNDYCIYFAPPENLPSSVTQIRLKFELCDFNSKEAGSIFLDEVEITRMDAPNLVDGDLIMSFAPPFAGWGFHDLDAPFGSVTSGNDPIGIYIETPGANYADAVHYGSWSLQAKDSGISYQSNKLYRCIYTLQTPDHSTIGKIRMINHNQGNEWCSFYNLVPDEVQEQMPDADGENYSLFYETMPRLFSGDDAYRNSMNFGFDLSDGNDAQEGRAYLTRVELYTYDLP